MSMIKVTHAAWNAPKNIKTIITTRLGGVSKAPYDTFNLGTHVGDELNVVLENRSKLNTMLPSNPYWLDQTHSNKVINLDDIKNTTKPLDCDATFTLQKNKVCVVMSADCIPILLTDKSGSFAAAIHAGWRGVENCIIKNTICAVSSQLTKLKTSDILVYIAPSICKNHFEVGTEVFEQFISQDIENNRFFSKKENNKFDCDLVGIAKLQMSKLGILEHNIYKTDSCTYCQENLYYSYRRDGVTGRIASLIWIE